MLKRNDLAKQFELVVQQEIKNFQDGAYQINQTLNELWSKISDLEAKTSKNHALLDSRHQALNSELDVLRTNSQKNEQRLDSHMIDNSKFYQYVTDVFDQMAEGFESLIEKCNHTKTDVDLLRDSIANLEKHRNAHFLACNNDLSQSELKITRQLENFKQYILDLPSECESLRTEMLEKINTHRIDVEGVLKEVRVTRKEVMILQKNIEAIYSLIDGLKKKEG